MAEIDIKAALADIESTSDLLERALKLSGLITTLFQRHGFPLVVVGGSAVEFYTEGGYMSGDIDFCRKTLAAIPPRLMQEIIAELGGKGVARSWEVCDSAGAKRRRKVAVRVAAVARRCCGEASEVIAKPSRVRTRRGVGPCSACSVYSLDGTKDLCYPVKSQSGSWEVRGRWQASLEIEGDE